MKWRFLQCQRQIFMSLSFFAEKVILELNCTKSLFRASKNTNSVFSATSKLWECEGHKMLKSFFSQWEKVANGNFKSKSSTTWKMFLLNENEQLFFAMQKTDFHELSFFAEKVILELNCSNHLFRASKNTNSVFSANKKNVARPQMLKSFFSQWEKLLNQF